MVKCKFASKSSVNCMNPLVKTTSRGYCAIYTNIPRFVRNTSGLERRWARGRYAKFTVAVAFNSAVDEDCGSSKGRISASSKKEDGE